MLREILSNYEEQLTYFFKHIDLEKAQKIEDALFDCKGQIVFAGVGKSGIIAEKISKTMVATGTPSFVLSVLNALHGDIGSLKKGDLVVLISKSGTTAELLELVPHLKKREVCLMAWTSAKNSPLQHLVDLSMELPMEQEVCPFKLAPTTSSSIQLIFGHTVSVSLMHRRRLPLSQYASNHPAGSIGAKIHLKVSDVMKVGDEVPRCLIGTSIKEGLFELTKKRCGCVVVEDQKGNVQGIFTDGDLRRALQSQGSSVLEQPIEKLMTKTFISAEETMSAFDAMAVMNGNKKVNVLPILKDKSIIGLIRMHDLVKQGVLDE